MRSGPQAAAAVTALRTAPTVGGQDNTGNIRITLTLRGVLATIVVAENQHVLLMRGRKM